MISDNNAAFEDLVRRAVLSSPSRVQHETDEELRTLLEQVMSHEREHHPVLRWIGRCKLALLSSRSATPRSTNSPTNETAGARPMGKRDRDLAEHFDSALLGYTVDQKRQFGFVASMGELPERPHTRSSVGTLVGQPGEADQPVRRGPEPKGSEVPNPSTTPAPDTTALFAIAQRISTADYFALGMDEDFRARLRERLVRLTPELASAPDLNRVRVQAQHSGRHAGLRRPLSARLRPSGAWRRRLLAAGVGIAVASGSVGGIAIASAGAMPGDPLYSAKKMFENIQLSLPGSPTDRGGKYLRLADIRLSEIDSLLQRQDAGVPNSPTAAYLKQALDDLLSMIGDGGNLLLDQVRANGDQQAVHVLSNFLLTERQRVRDLTWQVPAELQGQPPRIVALMDDLYQQLQQTAAAISPSEPDTSSTSILRPSTSGHQGGSAPP